jgi:CheY-like chemotaxis protein
MMTQHLLVVDDSPTVRKLVELTFRGTPWIIDYASTGGEAIQLARRTLPNVILLDFVLPDMHGVDVCQRLALEAPTATIPIVIMSGKETAPDLCRNVGSVCAYLTKPSTPALIRTEVEAAALRSLPPKPTTTAQASFAQKEAAARTLYALLHDALSHIPHWMKDLGNGSPAPFFARKLLTPQLTSAMIDALAPHFRDILGSKATPHAPLEPDLLADATFAGTMRDWPVVTIVTFFESSARRGALTLWHDGKETIAYLRGGEIISVTNRDPVEYMRGVRLSGRNKFPPEALKKASAEQKQSGVPVLVTLAATGYYPPADLTDALATRGRRLLMDALGAQSASFEWRDLNVLPAYVEAHGRHISSARNTLPFATGSESEPPPSRQRTLEQLRHSPPGGVFLSSAVVARPRGFSDQLPMFALTAAERQVLTYVDGQLSAERLAVAAGMELAVVLPILARLMDVQLLCLVTPVTNDDSLASLKRRPVMILEPDRDGFQRPLANMLQSRGDPINLIDLSEEQDLLAAIRREHPQQVLLNAAALPIANILQTIRSDPQLADVAVVAILEPDMATLATELTTAGFNSVLVKPITRTELERLFSS